MKTRIKVFLVLTVVVFSLTVVAVLNPPSQTAPERTIGIIHRGHRASLILPAEYEPPVLIGYAVFAWMLYLQGGMTLCLYPWPGEQARI